MSGEGSMCTGVSILFLVMVGQESGYAWWSGPYQPRANT